jgi:hypothetical protein
MSPLLSASATPWALSVFALLLIAGIVTLIKGRWGWFLLGLVFLGVFWPVSALMPPAPNSLWTRLRSR